MIEHLIYCYVRDPESCAVWHQGIDRLLQRVRGLRVSRPFRRTPPPVHLRRTCQTTRDTRHTGMNALTG